MISFHYILLIFISILFYLVYDYKKTQGTHKKKGYRIAFGSLILVNVIALIWIQF